MPYRPPPGTYDQPFYYIFDGSGLTDGQDALNQSISLDPGIGDFILRRAVGWGNVAAQYRLKDYSKNPLSGDALNIGFIDDGVYPREQFYPATGKIPFDLLAVGRRTPTAIAQVAFQGVRRQPGALPNIRAPYRFTTKTFSYISNPVQMGVSDGVTPAPAALVAISVNDFDFELLQIKIFYYTYAHTVGFDSPPPGTLLFFAVNPGPSGNTISYQLGLSPFPPANQSLSVTVTGQAILLIPATDGAGFITTTVGQAIAAIAAIPQAAALVRVIKLAADTTNTILAANGAIEFLAGGGVVNPALHNVNALVTLFDSVRFQTSNIPFNDVFINGIGPYQNGAIVPALLYPVSTQLRMNFYSLATAVGISTPPAAVVEFVGRNRFAC